MTVLNLVLHFPVWVGNASSASLQKIARTFLSPSVLWKRFAPNAQATANALDLGVPTPARMGRVSSVYQAIIAQRVRQFVIRGVAELAILSLIAPDSEVTLSAKKATVENVSGIMSAKTLQRVPVMMILASLVRLNMTAQ